MVEISAPLNTRQMEVLRWIAADRPDGVMTDFTYKTTAVALQGRRLVVVSKRGGVWSAELTDAGRFYLDHGHHPAHGDGRTGDLVKRPVRSAPVRLKRPAAPVFDTAASGRRAADTIRSPNAGVAASETPPSSAPQTAGSPAPDVKNSRSRRGPVDQLIADLEQAGGVLRVQRSAYHAGKAGGINYEQLILSAQRHGKVPAGKRLVSKVLKWPELEIRLEAGIPGTEMQPLPVPVSERVSRYHQVVAQFRDLTKRHEISKDHLSRALRILHALSVEAERRGHTVALVKDPTDTYGRDRWTGSVDRHIAITVDGQTQPLRILEAGMPSRTHWERTHYLSRESYAAAKGSGKLRIEVAGYGAREGRVYRWTDTNRATLEEKLPDVLREVEVRAAEDIHRDRERLRREAEERQAHDRAIERATAQLIEADRSRHLLDQISRWNLATRGRTYIAAMRATITARAAAGDQGGGDEATIEAATEWLTWAERHIEQIDPLGGELAMPEPPKVTPQALKPFLPSRWTPWS